MRDFILAIRNPREESFRQPNSLESSNLNTRHGLQQWQPKQHNYIILQRAMHKQISEYLVTSIEIKQ